MTPPMLFGFRFKAFGGPNELQLYASTQERAEHAARVVIDEALRIQAKFSRYDSESIISRIHRSAGATRVEIDRETAALFDYAEACYEQSDTLFDITSGVLRRAWRFDSPAIPTEETLRALCGQIGWRKVERGADWVRLPEPGMEIDFGGFGKEFAVDRAATLLEESGIDRALINFGGDVRVLGAHPDGTLWRVGIAHPRKPGEILSGIDLAHGALATSGDYERFFELDGKRYCHILNPHTGYPVDDLQSVTIVGSSCLIAGTLSTIGMLFGENRAAELFAEMGVPFILVTKTGELRSSIRDLRSVECDNRVSWRELTPE